MNREISVASCENKMAVRISKGFKTFKEKIAFTKPSNNVTVFQNFDLNVPAGSLYSLLGSSGCGKTTVISIIMGLCKLDAGELEVSTSSRALGYMPQETCLYMEFSIYETLQYFGILFGNSNVYLNSKDTLKLRIHYLRKLLLLPPEERIVGTLSGGQKRRLSLAVALIHEPDILILDEPTSGVDPLVRELIWEHLSQLVKIKATTVILTTHYVDEAKGSTIVGFMRNGQLIAEDTPSNLFETYGVNSMEAIFLALCQQQTIQNKWVSQSSTFNTIEISKSSDIMGQQGRMVDVNGTMQRIFALVVKNCKCTFRNIWMALLIIMLPALCILFTCFGFQNEPRNIALGIVNNDTERGDVDQFGCIKNKTLETNCQVEHLSCIFLESLDPTAIQLIRLDTIESAIQAVQHGNIWGYIHFSKNYSSALTNRVLLGSSSYFDESDAGKKEWNDSKIDVRLDQTNTLIRGKIITSLYEALEKSSKIMLKNCEYDERIAEYSLQYLDPIIGDEKMTSLKYVGPSLAIEMIYFFSLITAIHFISEKRDGTLERCMAGGARNWEILISYATAQSSVVLLQSIFVILVLHYGFSVVTYLSNIHLILALCWLQGLSGLAQGLLLAIFCNEEYQVAITTLAIVLPNAFLSGLLWPLEGLPKFIQEISPYLPMTLSGEAMRSLMIRGWDLNHPNVWKGFCVIICYIVLWSIIILLLIRKQLRR